MPVRGSSQLWLHKTSPALYDGLVMPKTKKYDRQKVTRFALWGGLLLGLSGFMAGSFVCLYYQLPIPPLFITELGLIVGGCLGALVALTNSEKRVLPTVGSIALSVPLCLGSGLGVAPSLVFVLGLAAGAWALAETSKSEGEVWKNV